MPLSRLQFVQGEQDIMTRRARNPWRSKPPPAAVAPDERRIAELGHLLEDPLIAGELGPWAARVRRMALVELLRRRGVSIVYLDG
jgi:hypothetical protein